MNSFTISKKRLAEIQARLGALRLDIVIVVVAALAALVSTVYSYIHGYIIVYGDAESHLNIAKRVIDSLTPGMAQLGGIWLPLPHLLLVPFVYSNKLWRTGLAGSIVSGIAFIVSALYVHKLTKFITKSSYAGLAAALVFIFNPNVLYLATTPMTELVLIVFFILSSYYFVKFLYNPEHTLSLIAAAFFGFCASLSRYDGWGLVLMEAFILFLFYLPPLTFSRVQKVAKEKLKVAYEKLEGRFILFSTLAFFGILLWLFWGFLILGDPLYFTHSQFSAKSQQQNWLAKGELPGYNNILVSIIYYFFTALGNAGILMFVTACIGLIFFLLTPKSKYRLYTLLLLGVPFIFNVVTLYLGQSVIFIPSLTPVSYEWRLFNVRYGVMMIPFIAVFVGYFFARLRTAGKSFIFILLALQLGLYGIGYSHVLSLQDGTIGLSSATAKMPDSQFWLAANYDGGLILADDFARTISIIRTPIPMEDVIYVGTKPYWEESLTEPEKYARWIVMQRHDAVWNSIWEKPEIQARLFKYFNKAYTSDEVLIFRRIDS
jgi:hypothetical protein